MRRMLKQTVLILTSLLGSSAFAFESERLKPEIEQATLEAELNVGVFDQDVFSEIRRDIVRNRDRN